MKKAKIFLVNMGVARVIYPPGKEHIHILMLHFFTFT